MHYIFYTYLIIMNLLLMTFNSDTFASVFQAYGSPQNNSHTFQLPDNSDRYYNHIITVDINVNSRYQLYDDKNNKLNGTHFKNGAFSHSTSIKIVVDTISHVYQCKLTVWAYAKQLSTPTVEAMSFHVARIKQNTNLRETIKANMRYRHIGAENWLENADADLKVYFSDEVYEAQLYHNITELGVTIESPIVVVKEHWKQMTDFLRINMEELAVYNTFSANFGERFLGDGIFSATIESIDNNHRTFIQLNLFASTLFYSKNLLRSGERYLFNFMVTSLSRKKSSDHVSITREFVVPRHSDESQSQNKEWISKFGNGLKFSSAGKSSSWDTVEEYKLQLQPNGWFILEIIRRNKDSKRLAGTFHLLETRSDAHSLSLYPLIKDKYLAREVVAIEGDDSGAHQALLLAEIINEIGSYLPHRSDCRLVCKYWYRSLPVKISAEIGMACNLRIFGQQKLLYKI